MELEPEYQKLTAFHISGIPPMVHHTDKSDYFREKLHISDGHDIAVSVLIGFAEKSTNPHKPNYLKYYSLNGKPYHK